MPSCDGVAWVRSGSSGAAASAAGTQAHAKSAHTSATAPPIRICPVCVSPRRPQPAIRPALRDALALEGRPVVELQHLDRAGRRGLDAELAQDALVQVLLDDLHVAVLVGVDVDRTGVLELLGEPGVVANRLVDGDVDEQSTHG